MLILYASVSLTPLPSFGSLSLSPSPSLALFCLHRRQVQEHYHHWSITPIHTEIFFSDCPVLRPCNMREMLEKHLKANGYLHIGHAKAMFIDFGLAKERGGCCYLR
ncbi:hypothetical protein ACSBR2_010243 [Camellia fascicularis]